MHVPDQLVSAADSFLRRYWPERFVSGSDELRNAVALMAARYSGTARLETAMFDVYAATWDSRLDRWESICGSLQPVTVDVTQGVRYED